MSLLPMQHDAVIKFSRRLRQSMADRILTIRQHAVHVAPSNDRSIYYPTSPCVIRLGSVYYCRICGYLGPINQLFVVSHGKRRLHFSLKVCEQCVPLAELIKLASCEGDAEITRDRIKRASGMDTYRGVEYGQEVRPCYICGCITREGLTCIRITSQYHPQICFICMSKIRSLNSLSAILAIDYLPIHLDIRKYIMYMYICVTQLWD
jgi:hypothetical protein